MYLCADDFERIILDDGNELTNLVDIDHVATSCGDGCLFSVSYLDENGRLITKITNQRSARFIRKDVGKGE